MLDFGIFKSVNLLMDCSCIAPLPPVVIVKGVCIPAFVMYVTN